MREKGTKLELGTKQVQVSLVLSENKLHSCTAAQLDGSKEPSALHNDEGETGDR